MQASSLTKTKNNSWGGGGIKPLDAAYGKLMMWFFIVSDALTFSGFLVAYGFSRFKNIDSWPIADEVFHHFPFLHGVDAPMYYVALMTFILIFSSVTMVLAVDAGHNNDKNRVAFYMLLTIIGGAVFVGSQAWEWKNFIKGEYGAVEIQNGEILQFYDIKKDKRIPIDDFAVLQSQERVTHDDNVGIYTNVIVMSNPFLRLKNCKVINRNSFIFFNIIKLEYLSILYLNSSILTFNKVFPLPCL